ncbi:AAA family ATPase [Bacillus sp. JJ1533]|uniref:AAA family ATPase n=1 Tax=Bacillus sp. JJ1533 TaxID=3122959 RepID=UPI002FFF3B1E
MQKEKNVIYLVSGPVGVGKSTTSKKLAQSVKNCVLLEGDFILNMFDYGAEASWEERLRLSWEYILTLTRSLIQKKFNIVIDFVVEDELDWFCEQISDLPVTLKYIVLRADKVKLIERINKRGDIELIDRSLFLLNKLETTPSNQPFLLDTTLKSTEEIVDVIMSHDEFTITI